MIDTNKALKNIINHIILTIKEDVDKVKKDNDKCMIKLNELIWNEYIKIVMSANFKEKTIICEVADICLNDLLQFKEDFNADYVIQKGNKLVLLFNKIMMLL